MSYKPKASQCLSVMLLLKYATGRTTFTQVDQLKARNYVNWKNTDSLQNTVRYLH